MWQKGITALHTLLFSDRVRERFEKITIYLGLIGFSLHLLLIFLVRWHVIKTPLVDEILASPITAIYTPFSFILFYEVYLLVYYLSYSFTTSIGKQYEIVSLILIRKIFKDIEKIDLNEQWYTSDHNLSILLDMVGFLVIFLLIFVFYRLGKRRQKFEDNPGTKNFVLIKQFISVLLVPILLGLALYSLGDWVIEVYQYQLGRIDELSNINHIFYLEFFITLILVDVFILILSFIYTGNYNQLIRNSGFIISTIMIRLSFVAENPFSIILSTGGIVFGVLILWIYTLYGQVMDEIELETQNTPVGKI